jgi:two-component system LytT family response regulator
MKLKCLIIDDKPLAVDLLADYSRKIPFLELIATTTNPIEGLSILKTKDIDLVFLDIQMPELSGLQFIDAAGPDLRVVLTTAYSEYAINGYEHDVIDYLLKPISFDRFYRAANKALKAHEKTTGNNTLYSNAISAEMQNGSYFFVKADSKLQKVNFADIIYIQGLQNYVVIHTINEKIISLQSLKRIGEQLPQNTFIRIHKSYMVSIDYISHIGRSGIYMSNKNIVVPVGDTYKEILRKIARL